MCCYSTEFKTICSLTVVMDKFWGIVGLLFVIGLYTAVGADIADSQEINFTDLETECRYDDTEAHKIGLEGRSISFEGNFPVNSTGADLSYEYRKINNRIVLDVVAENENEAPSDYSEGCLASVLYESSTEPLQPGDYLVELRHDGERVDRQIIRVK